MTATSRVRPVVCRPQIGLQVAEARPAEGGSSDEEDWLREMVRSPREEEQWLWELTRPPPPARRNPAPTAPASRAPLPAAVTVAAVAKTSSASDGANPHAEALHYIHYISKNIMLHYILHYIHSIHYILHYIHYIHYILHYISTPYGSCRPP